MSLIEHDADLSVGIVVRHNAQCVSHKHRHNLLLEQLISVRLYVTGIVLWKKTIHQWPVVERRQTIEDCAQYCYFPQERLFHTQSVDLLLAGADVFFPFPHTAETPPPSAQAAAHSVAIFSFQRLASAVRTRSASLKPPAWLSQNTPQKLPRVIGLDLARGWLTLAWRRSGKHPVLEGVKSIRLSDAIDWNTPECAPLVREALNTLDLSDAPGRVLLGLPDTATSVLQENPATLWIQLTEQPWQTRQYLIPKTRRADRDTVALLAARKEQAFNETNCLFDYRISETILDKGSSKIPVTALGVPRQETAALHKHAHESGLTPTGITSASVALQNLYASGWLACPWEQFSFVEIDEGSSRMALFIRGRLDFNRIIKAGIHSLVTALQNEPDSATHLDCFFRTNRTPEEEAGLLTLLASPLGRLGLQLERTVEYARHTGQSSLWGVVLSAPPFCASLVLKTFTDRGFKCHLLELNGSATPQAQQDLAQDAPQARLTQAIALCLSDSSTLNMLLPIKERRSLLRKKRIAHLSLVAASVLMLLTGLGCVHLYRHNSTLQQEKTALEMRFAQTLHPCTPEDLRETLALTQKRHAAIQYTEKRRLAAALVSELAAKTPETIQLTKLCATFPADAVAQQKPTSDPATLARQSSRKTLSENARSLKPSVHAENVSRSALSGNAIATISGTISGDALQRESRLAEYLNHLERSPLVVRLQIEKREDTEENTTFLVTLTLV